MSDQSISRVARLAEVVGGFTEGFDTADVLRAAKELARREKKTAGAMISELVHGR